MTVQTDVPSPERIEELVAQNEYQGGADYVRVCSPRVVTIPAHQAPRSEEAVDDPTNRQEVTARPQTVQTCACGQASKMTIQYLKPDGRMGMYQACAICDAVNRHPRFDGDPESVKKDAPGTEEAA